ncbi:MAG: transglutaminase-like domain-containing protein [Candidatus Fermentibacteraceae bacterium]
MRTGFRFACAALAAAAVSCGTAGGPAPSGAERGVQKFAVTLQDRDVGYMTLQVEELPSGSLLVSQSTEWNMRLMGTQSSVSMESEAVTDSSLNLGRMEFYMSDGSAEIRATTVRGDGVLEHTIHSAGREASFQREFEGDYIPALLDLAVAGMEWEEGQVRAFPSFDPSAGVVSEAEVTCLGFEDAELLGERVTAARLQVKHMGMTTDMLVSDGQIISEEEGGYGMRMTRVPPEQGGEVAVDTDLYDLYAVSSTVIDNPRRLGTRRFVLEGDIDWSAFRMNYPPLQSFDGNVVTVTSERPDSAVGLPVENPEFAQYLQPEPMIQSDDPAVVRLADSLTRGAGDAWEAALRLNEFVDLAVRDNPTVSLPSTVEVLESMRGDCNEHTILYVGLARAAGIPARVCAGLVYLDASFGYHAWPMVWVGEWVAVDPTISQEVADPTHIILAVGDLEAQYVIAQVMGRLSIREVQ